jgi:hypothetical protein
MDPEPSMAKRRSNGRVVIQPVVNNKDNLYNNYKKQERMINHNTNAD